jgi:glutathione S-transferase
MGTDYGLADALLTAYFFRIDCIGLAPLWESRFPHVTGWYRRVCERPSLAAATAPWLDKAAIDRIRQIGRKTFIEDADFPEYL